MRRSHSCGNRVSQWFSVINAVFMLTTVLVIGMASGEDSAVPGHWEISDPPANQQHAGCPCFDQTTVRLGFVTALPSTLYHTQVMKFGALRYADQSVCVRASTYQALRCLCGVAVCRAASDLGITLDFVSPKNYNPDDMAALMHELIDGDSIALSSTIEADTASVGPGGSYQSLPLSGLITSLPTKPPIPSPAAQQSPSDSGNDVPAPYPTVMKAMNLSIPVLSVFAGDDLYTTYEDASDVHTRPFLYPSQWMHRFPGVDAYSLTTPIAEFPAPLLHIGCDNFMAGQMSARRLYKLWLNDGKPTDGTKAVCVASLIGNEAHQTRCRGFSSEMSVVSNNTVTTTTISLTTFWQDNARTALMGSDASWLDSHFVFAVNDFATTVVAEAGQRLDQMKAEGLDTLQIGLPPITYNLTQSLPARKYVAGFDGTTDAVQFMRSHYLDVIIDQQPYLQGYLSVMLLTLHLRTGAVRPSTKFLRTGPLVLDNDTPDLEIHAAKEAFGFPRCRLPSSSASPSAASSSPSQQSTGGYVESGPNVEPPTDAELNTTLCFEYTSVRLRHRTAHVHCPRTDMRVSVFVCCVQLDMRAVIHVEAASNWGAVFRSGLLQAALDAGNVKLKDAIAQVASGQQQLKSVLDIFKESPRTVTGIFVSPGGAGEQEAGWNRSIAERIPIWLSNSGWPSQEFQRASPLIGGYIGMDDQESGVEASQRLWDAGYRRPGCIWSYLYPPQPPDRCGTILQWFRERGSINATEGLVYVDDSDTQRFQKQVLDAAPHVDVFITSTDVEEIDNVLKPLIDNNLIGPNTGRTFFSYEVTPLLFQSIKEKKAIFGIDQNTYLQSYLPMLMLILQCSTGGFWRGSRLVLASDPTLAEFYQSPFPIIQSGPVFMDYRALTADKPKGITDWDCGTATAGHSFPTADNVAVIDSTTFAWTAYSWPVCRKQWVTTAGINDVRNAIGSGLSIATFVLASTLVMLALFGVGGFFWTHRTSRPIIAISFEFTTFFIVLPCGVLYASTILFVVEPQTVVCGLRWWLPTLSLATILGTLLGKNYRILRLTARRAPQSASAPQTPGSSTTVGPGAAANNTAAAALASANPRGKSYLSVWQILAWVVPIALIILIVATLARPPSTEWIVPPTQPNTRYLSCTFDTAFAVLLFAYLALLLLASAWLSWKVRNVV